MKKLIFGAAVLIGACGIANANNLKVNNTTNCTYDLSIGGIGGGAGFTIAPPGASSFDSSWPSSGIFGVKIMYADVNGGMSQIDVSNGSPYANSLALPAPVCSSVGYLTAVWQVLPSGDVVLTLL